MSKFQVGDRVRVRKPVSVNYGPLWNDKMDRFDGTEQTISVVRESERIVRFVGDRNEWVFHFDWLEPVKPKTLNLGDPVEPMRSWVPDGYSVVEMAVPDEMAKQLYADSGTVLVWKPPKLGMKYLCPTTSHVRCATEDFSKCYPTATYTTPPAEQYREPTAADVGRMVDVRDREKEPWQDSELLAVIGDKTIVRRFVCRDVAGGVHCFHWKFARIKIEEVK